MCASIFHERAILTRPECSGSACILVLFEVFLRPTAQIYLSSSRVGRKNFHPPVRRVPAPSLAKSRTTHPRRTKHLTHMAFIDAMDCRTLGENGAPGLTAKGVGAPLVALFSSS